MNRIAKEIVQEHYPQHVFIWDSHLALQAKYKELCLKYWVKSDAKRMWACHDTIHSGSIIYDHYAQMLLNFLCQSQTWYLPNILGA